jgi:hypothetical protein
MQNCPHSIWRFLASFSRSSGIRQKLQNAKLLHFLEEKTQKKNKKNVAKSLLENGRYIQDGEQNLICL